jgi:hypothetical protein
MTDMLVILLSVWQQEQMGPEQTDRAAAAAKAGS